MNMWGYMTSSDGTGDNKNKKENKENNNNKNNYANPANKKNTNSKVENNDSANITDAKGRWEDSLKSTVPDNISTAGPEMRLVTDDYVRLLIHQDILN